MTKEPLIALTLGDVTGIGPEIVAKIVMEGIFDHCRIVVVNDPNILQLALTQLGFSKKLPVLHDIKLVQASKEPVTLLDYSTISTDYLTLGKPEIQAGTAAIKAISMAINLEQNGQVSGIVFAPLCKEALHPYTDELDVFRDLTENPGMARIVKNGNIYRTSVTGHIPLRLVPDLVTRDRIFAAIELLNESLESYGINPVLAVAALNPHGGEHGQCGQEEIEQIIPAVQSASSRGRNVLGPIPADVIFTQAIQGKFNGVVNLYHDQGNIAAKTAGFGDGIVLYVRSPLIMATPGHGTAFDIAGKGVADPQNLCLAIQEVARIARLKKDRYIL